MPGFVQANNGLGAVAALRGGDFATRVIMHFAGLDPPLIWVPPPKTAEVIPAWMDEPVVMPAAFHRDQSSGLRQEAISGNWR